MPGKREIEIKHLPRARATRLMNRKTILFDTCCSDRIEIAAMSRLEAPLLFAT